MDIPDLLDSLLLKTIESEYTKALKKLSQIRENRFGATG
jgi:hypothetical protein